MNARTIDTQVMNPQTFSTHLPRAMDDSWRAANYLSVGQLYRNPLLREPIQLVLVKPLIVEHWGTTPGQNFICSSEPGD